jgi:hypothetical protein
MLSHKHEMLAFRIVGFVIPPIVSCSLLAIFVWLLHLSAEGSPPPMEPSTKTDHIIIIGHLFAGLFLSILIFLLSLELSLNKLRMLFIFGTTALALTLLYYHILFLKPFIEYGWKVPTFAGPLDIPFFMYRLPLYAMIGTMVGLFIGFVLSKLLKNTR